MIRCKGKCDNAKWKRPAGGGQVNNLPFLTHGYCCFCAKWVDHEIAWKKNRCPCCHGKLRTKPRMNAKKKKYIYIK